jgi:hypothetical protein
MHFAIKITSAAGFDGETVLDRALLTSLPPTLQNTGSGVIEINVNQAVGLIDPDLESTAAANRNLILQSWLLDSAAGAGDRLLEMVDDEGRLAMALADLGSAALRFDDRGWIIPVGYRLRVTAPGPAVLRLNIWRLNDTLQLCSFLSRRTA